jgi:hypothetical protein
VTKNEEKILHILKSFPTPSLDDNDLIGIASDIVESLAESAIPQEVVNNELSTVTYLIDMVEMGEFERANKSLFKAKETVNKLCCRDVYSR